METNLSTRSKENVSNLIKKIVIKDAVDQLTILANIFKHPNEVQELEYKTIDERFSKEDDNKPRNKSYFDKVFIELKKVFSDTLNELNLFGTHRKLTHFLKVCEKMKVDEQFLIREYVENSDTLNNLKKTVANKNLHYIKDIFEKIKQIGLIKDEIEVCTIMYTRLEICFSSNKFTSNT